MAQGTMQRCRPGRARRRRRQHVRPLGGRAAGAGRRRHRVAYRRHSSLRQIRRHRRRAGRPGGHPRFAAEWLSAAAIDRAPAIHLGRTHAFRPGLPGEPDAERRPEQRRGHAPERCGGQHLGATAHRSRLPGFARPGAPAGRLLLPRSSSCISSRVRCWRRKACRWALSPASLRPLRCGS